MATSLVFSEWVVMSTLLASTIQKYHDSCSALALLCTRPPHGSIEKRMLDDGLAAVSTELLAGPSQDETLAMARKHLSSMKNRSALVNRLPPELLGYIFELSKDPCTHDPYSEPGLPQYFDVISGVCAHWRHVSLNTPSLWTHIEIISGPLSYQHRERATALLERSAGDALHVHLLDPNTIGAYPLPELEHSIDGTSTFLAPYMNRIRFLSIASESSGVYDSILNSWLDSISPGTTKGLSYYQPDQMGSIHFNRISAKPHDEHLLSLSVLRFQNLFFTWDSPAYHGLVDLQLEFTEQELVVSVADFASVLASSPGLVVLKLSNVALFRSRDWDVSATYALESLRVLNLDEMGLLSHRLLLSLISPSRRLGSLSMGLMIHDLSTLHGEMESFFRRSHITTLYARSRIIGEYPDFVVKILNWVPSLECLILDGYQIGDDENIDVLRRAELRRHARETRTTQPYRLPKLVLNLCTIRLNDVAFLVELLDVQSLCLDNCDIQAPVNARGDPYYDIDNFECSICERCPEIECVVSDEDTTWEWPCRTNGKEWINCF